MYPTIFQNRRQYSCTNKKDKITSNRIPLRMHQQFFQQEAISMHKQEDIVPPSTAACAGSSPSSACRRRVVFAHGTAKPRLASCASYSDTGSTGVPHDSHACELSQGGWFLAIKTKSLSHVVNVFFDTARRGQFSYKNSHLKSRQTKINRRKARGLADIHFFTWISEATDFAGI